MNLDQCVERAITRLAPVVRERFALNPLGVLAEELHFKVQAVEHLSSQRNVGGFCDGVSFLDDGVILYAPTPKSRRENFTLAHELGHSMVEQDDKVLDWLANQTEPQVMLETICDRIAQRLLLPEDMVASVLSGGVIRAQHVVDLLDLSQASRPACAIALAQHLPGLGAIVLIDKYSLSVAHASVRPDPEEGWPLVFPWRNQPVDKWHPLVTLVSGGTLTKRISWRTPWNKTHDFFADAIADDRRTIAVFSDVDIWSPEHRRIEEPRDFDKRPLLKTYCCGQEQWVRGYPCPTCHGPFCPKCGKCRCDRNSSRAAVCTGCFLEFSSALLVDGKCEDCR